MTFSSASESACEVDEVAATAAGMVGLRAAAGGNVACWRLAASIPDGARGAVFFAALLAAVALASAEPALWVAVGVFGDGTSDLLTLGLAASGFAT